MDHQEATRMQAPMRYLLGELSTSEQEGFEEHFFTCRECAEELEAGAVFAENARAVFSEHSRRPTATSPAGLPQHGLGWWSWLRPQMAMPLAAMLALVCVVGYQNAVTIPKLKSMSGPQAVLSFPLKIARGDETFVVPPDARFFTLYFLLPRTAPQAGYTCAIETAAGVKIQNVPMLSPAPGQPFTILLRRSDFSTGSYAVKVYAADNQNEVAMYPFNLKMD